MTNIATKNGAIVVKDGKAGEGCACCGGWYCYNQCEMPCRQASTYNGLTGSGLAGGGGYATEEDCLNACNEGACCETDGGTATCSIKPQCQCQGAGKVFNGIGTTCGENPCGDPCPTGRCCGPDVITIRPGETGPQARGGYTRSECEAIGGVYTPCIIVPTDEITGLAICNPLP